MSSSAMNVLDVECTSAEYNKAVMIKVMSGKARLSRWEYKDGL